MAAAKKKPKLQASEIAVGTRTLEGVLLDLAEQVKANDARSAHRAASFEERSASIDERSARAEEMAALALQTIAAVSQDLRAITQEMREANLQYNARFGALEKAARA